tara:strand:+ start:1134 stop:1268 length:135 start_codon:yes stop_codon:yes gene_type:complete
MPAGSALHVRSDGTSTSARLLRESLVRVRLRVRVGVGGRARARR